MAERLTKTALKAELTRRMEWFESSYGFNLDTSASEMQGRPYFTQIAFGRYAALREMRWQIDKGLFVGGFAA